jgi:hypothetical protein
MLRNQSFRSSENAKNHDKEAQSRAEAHENRLRVMRLSPKIRPAIHAPNSTPSKVSLWEELVTQNPIYQKETLSERRAFELLTPLKKFWKRVFPFLLSACIYLSIFTLMVAIYKYAHSKYPLSEDINNHFFYIKILSIVSYYILLIIQFFVIAIGIPTMAINKITAERERLNWDGLLTSRLTPMQILVGKVIPILKTLTLTALVLLPALAITAYLGREEPQPIQQRGLSMNVGLPLRGLVMAQVCLYMTALMNITIGLYFSLTEKHGAKAATKTGRWFAIPTLGTIAVTTLLFALLHLGKLALGKPDANTPEWLNPFLLLPNLINPIAATSQSLNPGSAFQNLLTKHYDSTGALFVRWCYYLTWLLQPYLYSLGCAVVIRVLWKRMLQKFSKTSREPQNNLK